MCAYTYLRTDEAEEALSALEALGEFLPAAHRDPYRWKWALLALHNALQGFMVLALRGSNGLAALRDDVAEEWLKAHEAGGPYPSERLDSFQGLYAKIKGDRMRVFGHSKPFAPKGSQGRSVKLLNSLRDEFIHFTPKGWSLELSGLPKMCLDCLDVIEFLYRDSGNVVLYEESQHRRVQSSLEICRRELLGRSAS